MIKTLTRAELEAGAQKMGLHHRVLYVVFSKPTNGLDAVLGNGPAHIAYQLELEKKGIMFAAGPLMLADQEIAEGEGLIVIRAASLEHAHQIAKADPMHQCGARKYTIRPWVMTEGSISIKLNYSNQTFELMSDNDRK
jgi:uncharacterized protein YciI